jgi:hypothetical protein
MRPARRRVRDGVVMDELRSGSVAPRDVGALRSALPEERVARNETVARRINEAIEDGRLHREGLTGFTCECGHLGCNVIVELSRDEYEAVRADGRQFLVARGHAADGEDVVARTPRYHVVVKRGAAGAIAEESDPRSAGA